MIKTFDRSSRVLAATALFGALVLAAPSHAQTPSPTPSQTPAPAAAPMHKTKASAKPMTREQWVEQQIAVEHTKLRITADQEPKWAAFTQVMRDSAVKIDGLHQQRHDAQASMTAVDDLKSYHDIAQARADEAQALLTAFQSLYESMTPDQQKNADMVFAENQGVPHRSAARANASKKS
jgi:protein CpxP